MAVTEARKVAARVAPSHAIYSLPVHCILVDARVANLTGRAGGRQTPARDFRPWSGISRIPMAEGWRPGLDTETPKLSNPTLRHPGLSL